MLLHIVIALAVASIVASPNQFTEKWITDDEIAA